MAAKRERTLTQRELNRALLARQLLLERQRISIPKALERIGGIQAQYAPAAYIRLWSSLEEFELAHLTRALVQRRAVQATLMRSTIHVVSRHDYWPFADGVGPSREQWWLRTHGKEHGDADLGPVALQLRAELAGRTWQRSELDDLLRAHGSTVWHGAWVPLVRVPPSGTWERRRADLFRLAEEWLGPSGSDEETGLERLFRRYLAGFGPARLADAASWAGVPVAKLRPAAERLELRTFRDEEGRKLLDLPRAPLPEPDTPAPPRFLPAWDATLLVHARRTQILPEEYRPLVFNIKVPNSVNTFLVDGQVAGTWLYESGKVELTPFAPLPRATRRDLDDEARRLAAFLA